MPDDESPDDETAPSPPAYFSDWTENTEPYERALNALLLPRGDRLTEIADREHVDPDILRTIARSYVSDHRILVESDGQRDNPRLYRNTAIDFFVDVWRTYSYVDSRTELESWHDELTAQTEAYQDDTGYDSPDEIVDDFDNPDADFSHLKTPETGEVYWDIVTPWREALHQRSLVEFALENYETLTEVTDFIDIENPDPYGDFANINAVRAKLGIDDDLPTDAEIDAEGIIHYPDTAETDEEDWYGPL